MGLISNLFKINHDKLIQEFKQMDINVLGFTAEKTDTEALKIILDIFKEAKRKQFTVPNEVDKKHDSDTYDAKWTPPYFSQGGTIVIEPTEVVKNKTSLNFVDGSGKGLVWHELGHLYHWKKNKSSYTNDFGFEKNLKFQIKDEVSNYAAQDSAEFVAEVFCGIYGPKHKKYSKDIMDLYEAIISKKYEITRYTQKGKLIGIDPVPLKPVGTILTELMVRDILKEIGFLKIIEIPKKRKAFWVVVPNNISRNDLINVIGKIFKATKDYGPKVISKTKKPEEDYLTVGGFSFWVVIEKNLASVFIRGKQNEDDLLTIIKLHLERYKKMDIAFQEDGNTIILCKDIISIEDTSGTITHVNNLVSKTYIKLKTQNGRMIPFSLKQLDAPDWETPDTYWGQTARKVLDYALYKNLTQIEPGEISRLTKAIAIQANQKETHAVVFGHDIYRNGAIIKQTWHSSLYKWDVNGTLYLECEKIIQNDIDIPVSDLPYFVIRNNKTKVKVWAKPYKGIVV